MLGNYRNNLIKDNDFLNFKKSKYSIIIIKMNGQIYEKYDVDNPWSYINELKKNPEIKNAYIKKKIY